MSNNLKKRLLTSVVLIFILILISINNYALAYLLMIAGLFSLFEFSKIISIIFEKFKIKILIFNLLFTIYIFTFCVVFFTASYFSHLKLVIFIILLTCILSDLGGYFFGKIFKGPKLTKISPKKTISGSLGSLFFSSIFLSSSIYFLTENFSYKILLIGCIISIGCQAGDLFFSYLKRKSNLEDTGNFLPGHGGLLDRIDGLLLGLPIGILSLSMIY